LEHDPVILQSFVAIPVTLGLALYTLLRWERSALHVLLAALLVSLSLWLGGQTLKLAAETEWIRLIGLDLEMGAVIFMAPLFLIMMGYFARAAIFEEGVAPAVSLLTIGALFLIGYWTDSTHHFFFTDRDAALNGQVPAEWGGPLFWALQLWCVLCLLAAFGYCISVIRGGRTAAERGRGVMVLIAVLIPTLAHFAYALEWLPLNYSLAPGALALTALFFVQGVHRYGLLGSRSLVRHDLIEHLDEGLLLADPDGVVIDVNATAERTLGTTREKLRGQFLCDVLALLDPEDDIDGLAEKIATLPLDNGRISGEISTRSGRFFEMSGGAVPELGTQPAGRFVTLVDRTAQRRSERLLRERQKLESVGILAAGVAHEVNNPLSYVRANLAHLQSLAEEMEKDDDVSAASVLSEMPEVLSESIEGLDRIARIVESMLRFSRVPDERSAPVDITRVIGEALRLATLERNQDVRVYCSTPSDLPTVMGSAPRLVQVFLNLFLNARQALHGQSDARIDAVARPEGDHVVVHVRDNGPGVPVDLQQRIFDPFFTTRPPDQGTGLGLSIAFDIIREHDGTLELESPAEGGCCFTIRLPASRISSQP